MFAEDECLPVSALSHLVFCERRFALIHMEGQWADNPYTLEGAALHQRVDQAAPRTEIRTDVRIARGLYVRSLRLGIVGKSDVLEFHKLRQPLPDSKLPTGLAAGMSFSDQPGLWRPFPVEYKRGRPKPDHGDIVQLCGQALCLEETLGVWVPTGAIFYGKTRRRLDVAFDQRLRRETETTATRLHDLFRTGVTPKAYRQPKCSGCSLVEVCVPDAMQPGRSARRFLESVVKESLQQQ